MHVTSVSTEVTIIYRSAWDRACLFVSTQRIEDKHACCFIVIYRPLTIKQVHTWAWVV